MIILFLDPHLVDASVNFEDLGYLQLLISFASCIFGLRLSLTFITTFGGCQVISRFRLSSGLKIFVGECKIIS